MGAAEEVEELFARRGGEFHGEAVDQRSHALQCAALARASGAGDALTAAALLHDIGHLLGGADTGQADADDRHEFVGARWVSARFGPAVARPVALHVLAKRYRCTVDPAYAADLSPTSTRTLAAQGGLLDADAAARFAAHPGAEDALRLRAWDEAAKDPGAATGDLAPWLSLLRDLATGA
jgi:phosphonate degradation associated HDIG domain protein